MTNAHHQGIPQGGKRDKIPLNKLLLDDENPRFGDLSGKAASQINVLDHIVAAFGVDDVLSSLAVNGYFDAEPLVCVDTGNGDYIVVEGNRRLAACLIISNDPRAANQKSRHDQFAALWVEHGKKAITPVPVICFTKQQEGEILAYLGVRHISGTQPWDSYAKASWVARVVERNKLPLVDVARMVGDHHKTVVRLLEGYYFMQQIVEERLFNPRDSIRKGRGSVTEYPFSWVYTLLGYASVRDYLGLEEGEPQRNPISKDNLPRAGTVVRSLFGDRTRGLNSAIYDSRELGDLAAAFSSVEKVALLEAGRSVAEIRRMSQPLADRLRSGLAQIRDIQSDLISGLSEQTISSDVAEALVGLAGRNRRSAQELERKLKSVADPNANDD